MLDSPDDDPRDPDDRHRAARHAPRRDSVLAEHSADIKYVDIHAGDPQSEIYLEFTLPDDDAEALLRDLRQEPGVASVAETPTFGRIYGKRVIVMGGGAQVGMVAMGAIAEADRHNIRGERISVDTIPLVGEHELAAAVRATARAAAREAAGPRRLDHGR